MPYSKIGKNEVCIFMLKFAAEYEFPLKKNKMMYLFKKEQLLNDFLKKKKQKIAFVPTMGALHNGHLSLIKKGKDLGGLVVSSIFVNPTQFDNAEDLKKYPRTVEDDVAKLVSVETDVLFLPSVDEIYPKGTEPTKVYDFGELDQTMEGEHRDGHFAGVAQVVNRLLEIVRPDWIVMGQKDIQQTAIVRSLLKQTSHKTQLVIAPTIREADGLAMSSRNRRLLPEERAEAPILHTALQAAKAQYKKEAIGDVKAAAIASIEESGNLKVDYFEIVDLHTMQPIAEWGNAKEIAICTAAFLGKVRLIDNVLIM